MNNKKDIEFTNNLWNLSDKDFFNCPHYSVKYSWRTQFLKNLDKTNLVLENGDFYQIGVYNGSSIKLLLKLFNDLNIKFDNIYGFDSFTGLPKENICKLNPKSWYEKRFNLTTFGSIHDIKNKIINFINYPFKINLIDGYFKDTMNKDIIKKYNMKPALYIDMDCDIYSSTVETLNFFYDNKLLQKGTIIGYDDWSMGNINKYEYKGGQSRAHKEFCIKNNIKMIRFNNFKLHRERAVFMIQDINYH